MKNYYAQFKHQGEDGWCQNSPLFPSRRKLGRWVYSHSSNKARIRYAKEAADFCLWGTESERIASFVKHYVVSNPKRQLKRTRVVTYTQKERDDILAEMNYQYRQEERMCNEQSTR